jgi:PEP-CTERM motif
MLPLLALEIGWGGAFPQDQQVGPWDSQGNLLTSVYVTGSESTVGAAPWAFESIAPVELTAGQTYVVGAQGGANYTGLIPSPTFDPRITYVTDLYTYIGGASNNPLVEPTSTESAPYGWFGANIELSAAVPEPSTWAMMILGFAALGFAGYHRAREGNAAHATS